MTKKAWEKVPRCKCGGPLILAEEHHRGDEIPTSLICAACGEFIDGTPQQVERARKASRSWDLELQRQQKDAAARRKVVAAGGAPQTRKRRAPTPRPKQQSLFGERR